MVKETTEEHTETTVVHAMTIDMGELVASDAWQLVYEECWGMWREGMIRLRKAEDGRTADRAKQQMDDAERILKMPLRNTKAATKEEKRRYEGALANKEEKTLKGVFNQ